MNNIIIKKEDTSIVDEKKLKDNPLLKLIATGSCNTCPMGKEIYGDGYPCKYYKKDAVCHIDTAIKKIVKTDKPDFDGLKNSAYQALALCKERYASAILRDKIKGEYNTHVESIGRGFTSMVEKISLMEKLERKTSPHTVKFEQTNIKQEGFSEDFVKKLFDELVRRKKREKMGDVVVVDAEVVKEE